MGYPLLVPISNIKRLQLFIVVCTLLLVFSLHSNPLEEINNQTTSPPSNFWVSAGTGLCYGGKSPRIIIIPFFPDGISREVNFSYQKNRHVYTLRYNKIRLADDFIFPDEDYVHYVQEIHDLGLLYNLIKVTNRSEKVHTSLSGGVSYFWGDKEMFFKADNYWQSYFYLTPFSTVGIPLSGQYFYRPFPFFGIGIMVTANLNLVRSYYSWLWSVQLGKLR